MDITASIDKQSPVPIYYQLKEFLKKKLSTEYAPGDKFLSEREIAKIYSISRVTASRVMDELLHEKYLIRIQGKGSFVNDFKREKTWNIGYLISPRLIYLAERTHTEADSKQLGIIHDICWQQRYNLLFFRNREVIKNKKYLESMVRKVDGLIISGDVDKETIIYLDNLLPVVLLDHYIEGKEISSVMADNITGAYEIVSYLLQLGHRRIGHIYGHLIAPSFRERLAGYKKALLEYEIPVDENLIVKGGGLIEDGIRAMNELLNLKEPPTAVFAGNDMMAMGALHAIRNKGMHIPSDISVAGFDANVKLYYDDLPLTTVNTNISGMAQACISLLFDKIENNQTDNKKVIVPVEIVYGNSVCPPKNKK